MTRKYAANRIRELRRARGISQEELGAAMPAELTGSTIAKLESGRMALSLDYILDISKMLRVDPAEIFPGDGAGVWMVPLIDVSCADDWQRGVTMSDSALPAPPNISGDNLFFVACEQGEFGFSDQTPMALIDPDQRDLTAGKSYLIKLDDGTIALRRLQADPLALVPCRDGDQSPEVRLGPQPFSVIGRVVYIGLQT